MSYFVESFASGIDKSLFWRVVSDKATIAAKNPDATPVGNPLA